MKNGFLLILFVLIFLVGCGSEITEEYLIDSQWIPKSGYENGEMTGEPNCIPVDEGIRFEKDGIVYVEAFDRDFEYVLSEEDSEILFRDTGPDLDPKATPDHGVEYFNYDIKVLSDDEIALKGRGLLEGYNCYMVRK